MRQRIYDPAKSGQRMTIACFVSGSGTNYREIAAENPLHDYLVFTNRPGCGAVAIARKNGHEVIELSHVPFLKDARSRHGPGAIPRNCPERVRYEQAVCGLIEGRAGKRPDLICLAGYDQWLTDWTVETYFPHILNVHPGDTTRGYNGLHWIPTAKAILAGDKSIRSTLFIVDKGEDTGPVLVQSAALDIVQTLHRLESAGMTQGLLEHLKQVTDFAAVHKTITYDDFRERAGYELLSSLERVCTNLQEALKLAGDWKIYPLGVSLIARGRVEVDDRTVFLDGKTLPLYGYRLGD